MVLDAGLLIKAAGAYADARALVALSGVSSQLRAALATPQGRKSFRTAMLRCRFGSHASLSFWAWAPYRLSIAARAAAVGSTASNDADAKVNDGRTVEDAVTTSTTTAATATVDTMSSSPPSPATVSASSSASVSACASACASASTSSSAPTASTSAAPASADETWGRGRRASTVSDRSSFDQVRRSSTGGAESLSREGVEGEIQRDIRRTFPENAAVSSPAGQNMLANVLKMVALRFPEIDYCQGMNYVVASLYLVELGNLTQHPLPPPGTVVADNGGGEGSNEVDLAVNAGEAETSSGADTADGADGANGANGAAEAASSRSPPEGKAQEESLTTRENAPLPVGTAPPGYDAPPGFDPERPIFHVMAAWIEERDVLRIWEKDVPGLKVRIYQFDQLVARLLRPLAAHFRREQLRTDYFASQWFLTLFAFNLPLPTLVKVWDSFAVDGWSAMFRTGLAILSTLAPQLIHMDLEESSHFLRSRAVARGGGGGGDAQESKAASAGAKAGEGETGGHNGSSGRRGGRQPMVLDGDRILDIANSAPLVAAVTPGSLAALEEDYRVSVFKQTLEERYTKRFPPVMPADAPAHDQDLWAAKRDLVVQDYIARGDGTVLQRRVEEAQRLMDDAKRRLVRSNIALGEAKVDLEEAQERKGTLCASLVHMIQQAEVAGAAQDAATADPDHPPGGSPRSPPTPPAPRSPAAVMYTVSLDTPARAGSVRGSTHNGNDLGGEHKEEAPPLVFASPARPTLPITHTSDCLVLQGKIETAQRDLDALSAIFKEALWEHTWARTSIDEVSSADVSYTHLPHSYHSRLRSCMRGGDFTLLCEYNTCMRGGARMHAVGSRLILHNQLTLFTLYPISWRPYALPLLHASPPLLESTHTTLRTLVLPLNTFL